MAEWQLYPAGTIPEWTTPGWYQGRDRAPHLEQDHHRARLHLAAELALDANPLSVVDLGAGDGGLLSLLPADVPAWGYDLQPTNLAGAAERGVDVRYGDVVDGPVQWADVAVATELIEHLLDPAAFVARVAQQCRVLVASSPWTETSANHYEFHTFAWDKAGYRALIERSGFTVTAHKTVDMFQVIRGEKQ